MRNSFRKESLKDIVRPYRWQIGILSGLTVLQSLLQVVLAVITRFVIDSAISGNGKLPFWGVLLLGDSIAILLVHWLLAWFAGSTTDRFGAQLRRRMLCAALYSRDEKLHAYHSGELMSRAMEDVRVVCDGVIQTLPLLVGQVTRLIAAFAAVVLIYPPVAAVLAVVACLVVVGAALLRPILKARHREVRHRDEKVMSTTQESFQQLELIQGLSAQKQILSRFDVRLKESLKAKARHRRWSVGANTAIGGLSQLGSGILLLWGAAQIAAGDLSYGTLTSMLQLLSQFRSPVLSMSGLWTRLAGVEVAAERLQGLLEDPAADSTERMACRVDGIVFEKVTFAYPGEETPVVENFSARFPVSGWACLTGISGKGKSTLFKLMLGLYEPQKGRVYLETDQGELLCSEKTRQLFAYVPQDYAMFSGTVLENLQLVAPEMEDEQLKWALSLAQADFVMDSAAGEQTVLGENNTGLSMGQMQRLAIARAILMDRPIFLLDECTSALDVETEKAVLRGLRSLGKNAILVTHRPEALDDIGDIAFLSMEQ